MQILTSNSNNALFIGHETTRIKKKKKSANHLNLHGNN